MVNLNIMFKMKPCIFALATKKNLFYIIALRNKILAAFNAQKKITEMLLVKTFLIFLYCDYWEQNNQFLSSVYRYFSRRSILAVTVWNIFFVILNNSWPNVSAFQTDRVMRPCLETRKMLPNRSIGRKRVDGSIKTDKYEPRPSQSILRS